MSGESNDNSDGVKGVQALRELHAKHIEASAPIDNKSEITQAAAERKAKREQAKAAVGAERETSTNASIGEIGDNNAANGIASGMNAAAAALRKKTAKSLMDNRITQSLTDEFDEHLASLPIPGVEQARSNSRPVIQGQQEDDLYDTMHPPVVAPRVPKTPKPGNTRLVVSSVYDVVEQDLPETPPTLPPPRVKTELKPTAPQQPYSQDPSSVDQKNPFYKYTHEFYKAVNENPQVRIKDNASGEIVKKAVEIQKLAYNLSQSNLPLKDAPGFIKDDNTGIWTINPTADKTQINGPIFMSRIDGNKNQVLDESGKPIYDVLYYNKGKLDITRSFIAPDDVPPGSRPTIDPAIRAQVIHQAAVLSQTPAAQAAGNALMAAAPNNSRSAPGAVGKPLPPQYRGRTP